MNRAVRFSPECYSARCRSSVNWNASDNFIVATEDVNGNGWDDILVVGFPGEAMYWYENTEGSEGFWPRHVIHPSLGNESPGFYDLNGDENLELAFQSDGYFGYAEADPNDPTAPWSFHRVSRQREDWERFIHGLGIGDITGNGYPDIVTCNKKGGFVFLNRQEKQ